MEKIELEIHTKYLQKVFRKESQSERIIHDISRSKLHYYYLLLFKRKDSLLFKKKRKKKGVIFLFL